MDQQVVMFEEELRQIATACERFARAANAMAVLLIDRNGQVITGHGEAVDNLDKTSLGTLAASNVATTNGLDKLIGEGAFPNEFDEGTCNHMYLSVVAQGAILVVIFDKRSSLGLVRLRLKKTTEELTQAFNAMTKKSQSQPQASPFEDVTAGDIDKLFGD